MTGCERMTHVRDTGNATRTAQIRALNDGLRRYAHAGVIFITSGVQALGQKRLEAVLVAVRTFDDFGADGDPYNEHDFGALRVGGARILWKIDYYDRDRRYGSPNPADPAVTTRVLTIMLASEY